MLVLKHKQTTTVTAWISLSKIYSDSLFFSQNEYSLFLRRGKAKRDSDTANEWVNGTKGTESKCLVMAICATVVIMLAGRECSIELYYVTQAVYSI